MYRLAIALLLGFLIYQGIKEWLRCRKLEKAEEKRKEAELAEKTLSVEEETARLKEKVGKRGQKLEIHKDKKGEDV